MAEGCATQACFFSTLELWSGQSGGIVSIFNLCKGHVTSQEVLLHNDPLSQKLDVQQVCFVSCVSLV